MSQAKAKEIDFQIGPFIGGITLYPYQITIGVSVKYWPCIFAPSLRIDMGPIRIWLSIIFKRNI